MKRNSRGFTLVEILIVVIILGILAAIVIPADATELVQYEGELVAVGEAVLPNLYHPLVVL